MAAMLAVLAAVLASSGIGGAIQFVDVFGTEGWKVPADPSGVWSAPQDLQPGAILNFTFPDASMGHHNVWLLKDRQAYHDCDFTGAVELSATSPAFIRINRKGRFFFACAAAAEGRHCIMGQKVSVGIQKENGSSINYPKGTGFTINSKTKSSPSKKTKVVAVFGAAGWNVPQAGAEWVQPPVHAGDRLNFSSASNESVYLLPDSAAFEACNLTDATLLGEGPDVLVALPKSGKFYYSADQEACGQGQKAAITVLPRLRDSPPLPAVELLPSSCCVDRNNIILPVPARGPALIGSQPRTAVKPGSTIILNNPTTKPVTRAVPLTKPKTAGAPKIIQVFGPMGWTVPIVRSFQWKPPVAHVGDVLVFNYQKAFTHNVWLMPSWGAYQKCDFTKAKLVSKGGSDKFLWRLTRPGWNFFACNAFGVHCKLGQKFAIYALRR